jgi:hypothetical protein
MNTHTATPLAHIDITPPSALLYATSPEADRCPSVALLHNEASPLQLLGFAHGRCRELAMLASFASRSDGAEDELKEAAEHLFNGLDTLLTVLDAMYMRMKGQP